jgi:protein-S-isoprenylcysteine O-methyltransferase Ste14
MTNPFDWAYLTKVPKNLEAFGPLAIAYVVIFGLGLIAALALGRWLDRRFRDHALHRRLAQRATQIAAWIFGVGLTFFAFRALELPFLGMRLWLYLSALALLVAIGLAIWYWFARYPAQLARYEQEQAKRQYLRPGAPSRQRRQATGRRR